MHNEVNGPREPRREAAPRRVIATVAASAMLGAAAAMLTAGTASAAPSEHGSHPKNGKVTLCHATPPATAKNGWVQITVSTNAVTHAGHDGHADDIIPAFTYYLRGTEHHYSGKNLATMFDGKSGQDVLASGCATQDSNSATRTGHRATAERTHAQRHHHHASAGTSPHKQQTAHSRAHRNGKVTLCHATPPATAKNGWVQITVSTNAVTHAGHDGHADDIIPAFTYYLRGTEHHYPGKNLATDFNGITGEQLLTTGCAMPTSVGAPATTQRSTHLALASGDRRSTPARRHNGARHAPTRSQSDTAATSRVHQAGGPSASTDAVATSTGVDATEPSAQSDAASRATAARVPAAADARGLAVGDTGDHGSDGPASPGVTAAVVGAALAALLGLVALAYWRRRSNGADA